MQKKILLFILISLFSIYFVHASYYGNVFVEVYENGLVEITGESNHPYLKEGIYDNLTTKQKGYWTLNISTKERFSKYTYELNLPKNSQINYLGVYAIDTFEDDNGFKISGTVENKPFSIIVQYRIKLIAEKVSFLPVFLIFLIIFAVAIIVFYFLRKKQKKSEKSYDKNDFSEREFLIISILHKNKGAMTQAELEKKTNLPKASLSRNIASLERKNIIEKNKTGMTNKIKLVS
jgi:uncharacterized membrane protein